MEKWILFSILFFALSCSPSPSEQDAEMENELPTPPVDEDALTLRMIQYLITSPKTEAERQQNQIVNYALDQLWDLKLTPSGLFYQILEEGEGAALQWGDRVKVDYEGRFLNGDIFDSSYQRGQPITFYIGNMVHGWNEGLQLLKPGAKARLVLPAKLGYGDKGLKNAKGKYLVPPEQVLIFELEVLEQL